MRLWDFGVMRSVIFQHLREGNFLANRRTEFSHQGDCPALCNNKKNRKDIVNYEVWGGGGPILLRLPWMVVVVLSTRLVSMLNPNTVLTFESMVPFRVMLSSGK